MARPMPTALDALREEIDAQLTAAWDRLLPPVTAIDRRLAPITAELRAFTSAGKRIRPALLLLGFEAAGGRDRRRVYGPALALELLHTCALAHDDVIDRAPTRRGRPSVHRSFASAHLEAGWEGDPDEYGEAVAILLGDLAFVHADALFLEAEVPADALLEGLRRFVTLREEVMAGQFLDLQAATSRDTDRATALAVATLKSGRYSVSRPLEVGAALAGAEIAFQEALRATADPLGRAFQLRDDLLGMFGDASATGKSTASDLAEGKRTLLIAEAAARLDDAGRTTLEAGLGDPTLSDAQVDQLRRLLIDSGARDAVEATIADEVAAFGAALADLALPDDVRVTFEALADYLADRSA